ncbi:MAG: GNAT family N-acetyltransferase [Candidatus Methylacidiphilales bacterium]|nr:GNAT family N-acetyltransferase [Candidatus Methylacidiphilales bacterium]
MPSPSHQDRPRLRLEFVRPFHAQAIQKIVGHRKLAEFTRLPHPYPGDGAITFVRESLEGRIRGHEYVFAIMEHEMLRGVCGVQDIEKTLLRGDLGYWVDPAHWGRGIATESARAVCRFAFHTLGLTLITGSHASLNTASGRVMQKIGFRLKESKEDERLGEILCYELCAGELVHPQEPVEMHPAAARQKL